MENLLIICPCCGLKATTCARGYVCLKCAEEWTTEQEAERLSSIISKKNGFASAETRKVN
jgi:hypothetical protein